VGLLSGEAGTQSGLIMAAPSLAVIPVLIVFQRQITQGTVMTGRQG